MGQTCIPVLSIWLHKVVTELKWVQIKANLSKHPPWNEVEAEEVLSESESSTVEERGTNTNSATKISSKKSNH
jgi:hypothetical protein